jgi:hypothetical protein
MLARDFARGFIQAANPRVATRLGGTRVMVDQRAQMSALGQKRMSREASGSSGAAAWAICARAAFLRDL